MVDLLGFCALEWLAPRPVRLCLANLSQKVAAIVNAGKPCRAPAPRGRIDALIALQGTRIRSSGGAPRSRTGAGRLMRLKAVAGGLKEGSGEEKVDQMLGEIELRVAVELAKPV